MARTNQQRRSRRQERLIAKDIGGKEQPASGASWSAKGDVRKTGDLRIEAKYTDKDFFSLKLADVLKIRNEALMGGEYWALQIDFALHHTKFAVLDFKLYEQMNKSLCLFTSDLVTVGKSIRLSLKELYAWHVEAAKFKEQSVIRLLFDTTPLKNVWVFALTDWDEFLRLREAFNS